MDGYKNFMSTSETQSSGSIDCREERFSLDGNGEHIGFGPAETAVLATSLMQRNVSHIVSGTGSSVTNVQDSEDVKRYEEFFSENQTNKTGSHSSESVKNCVQKNMKSKVDSFTQVEGDFENELCRNIEGQERLQNIQVAGTSSVQRENRKYVRPPLVGQASSSSNESGSVPIGRRRSASSELDNSYEEHDVSPPSRLLDRCREPCSSDGGTYYTGLSVRNFNLQPSCLTNRDDYINERPPEGSDQYIIGTVPADQPDGQRIPSPSSVSSVNSARPLEWDSGADVGYYQNYVAGNQGFEPGLSTIERIALVRGTAALLTRSDPEGTTGPSRQVAPVQPPSVDIKTKRSKDFIGLPKGESTPVNFLQNKSSSTSAESETEISPIINENNSVKNPVSMPSVNSKHSDDIGLMAENKESKKSQKKYPLFPELVRSKLQETKRNVFKNNVTGAESADVNNIDIEYPTNPNNVEMNDKHDTRLKNKIEPSDSHFCENNDMFIDNNVINIGTAKKLSSSLENIRDLNKLPESDDSMPQVSRPRSRSQSNLFTYPPDSVKSDENFPRSMAFHYPKSGSSSSIATVVQKKRDSPKHLSKLVQTNSLMKHSTGIQACDGDRVQNGISLSNATTPHILSREFKSNFKDMLDKEELNASEAQRKQIESKLFPTNQVGLHNDLPQDRMLEDNHYHDGILCTGAHKKTYQTSLETQQSLPPVRTAILETATKKNTLDKKPDDRFNSTLESVESSAKSHGGYFFERQSSVTVEDRVNSFEYLPGDVYENAGRHAGTTSDAASSESARIELNEDKDRLWDSSASSTLVRDVHRGVDIMMDFIKSSHANDKQLKHKLIRRVVQKLINSDYASDRQEERISLESNIPWVPPVIQTKPTSSGRETRPFSRSRVPGDCTSSSVGTTINRSSSCTSSECFRPPLKKDISTLKTVAAADKCIGTGRSLVSPTPTSSCNKNVSATPYVTSDSLGRQYDIRRHSPQKHQTHVMDNLNSVRRGRAAADANDTTTTTTTTNTSDTIHSSSSQANWKQPVTKTEKLYEQRRKQQEKQSKVPSADVLRYLDMERENQLFWIRSEIQHLNNLKTLLEKQEELKENIKEIRKSKYRSYSSGPVKKDNEKHHKRDVASSGSSANYKESSSGVIASPKKTLTHNSHQSGPSTLRSWLLRQHQRNESSEESHHNNPSLYKIDSHRQVRKSGKEWTSHQNLSRMREEEAKKNLKGDRAAATNRATSGFNPMENKSILKARNPVVDSAIESSVESRERPHIIHTSPQRSSYTKEEDRKSSANNRYADSVLKKTEKSQTESLQRVHDVYGGKGEERKVQKGKQNKCPCERDGYVCKCCKDRKLSGEDRTKQPLGYYITFEQSPIRVPKKRHQQQVQTERAEIIPPYTEPVVRHPAVQQEVVQTKKFVSSRDQKPVRSNSSDTDSQSKDKSDENSGASSQRNPTLQDYLVKNRPDYVSRAEDRRQCVAELVYLRELRDRSKRRLLELTDSGPATRELPPPPLAVKRVFNQRTMRRQTEKKYRQLSEVQGKQQDMKRKQAYRTNRLMAQVFTKKLQRRVLKGDVNLSNSVSVISNI